MKSIKILYLLIALSISFGAFAETIWDNGYNWEYYDFFRPEGGYSKPEKTKIINCSLSRSADNPEIFIWKIDSLRTWWRQDGEIIGEEEVTHASEPEAQLRIKDDKVSIIITPEYAEKHNLRKYEKGEWAQDLFEPVELEDTIEVTLYDFNVKPGDCYPTLLYGNLLTTAYVLENSFREDILGGVRQVKILCDFNLDWFGEDYEPGMELTPFMELISLSYIEKIGNITDGTFTELNPFWNDSTGSLELETKINNVFNKDGEIVYHGKGFKGYSGINGISAETPELSTDAPIYDLHGRHISNPLPGTVYIRNGRKYVK